MPPPSTLYVAAADDDGKGDVEFWVCPATSTTYNWEIKKTDNSAVANGTLSEANSYKSQKTDLSPEKYYLRVTKQNGGDYERKINFTVLEVEITTPAPASRKIQ